MNISNSQTIIYSLGSEKRKRKLLNDSTGIIMSRYLCISFVLILTGIEDLANPILFCL